MTGGVCAILDTPLKFNHHLAEAKLSDVLLSELACLNVALRVYCTASGALALVLGGILVWFLSCYPHVLVVLWFLCCYPHVLVVLWFLCCYPRILVVLWFLSCYPHVLVVLWFRCCYPLILVVLWFLCCYPRILVVLPWSTIYAAAASSAGCGQGISC